MQIPGLAAATLTALTLTLVGCGTAPEVPRERVIEYYRDFITRGPALDEPSGTP